MSEEINHTTTITTESAHEQLAQRREKLEAMRKQGNAYPNNFSPEHVARELHDEYGDKDNEALESLHVEVTVAGRIMMRRLMGKASFATVQDRSGQIQLYVKKELLPEGLYDAFKHWDLGDIVGARGELFKTRTGELSVKVSSIALLTKALRNMPDKFHGLVDHEQRYRQRYLDVLVNEDSRRIFTIRSKLTSGLRQFFDARDYIELETPMMQKLPGGAAARPFITHHNTLDMKLYMRIAPELFLKRMIVGGFDRVYEINRNFRNEGISTQHNPEFTMLEFYQA